MAMPFPLWARRALARASINYLDEWITPINLRELQ